MRYKFYKNLFLVLLIGVSYDAFSQSDTTAPSLVDTSLLVKAKKKSSFKIGADYLSNNVFMGRTGLTNVPIITLDSKYTFKPGLYFSASIDVLPDNKKGKKIDGGNLSVGYDFDITDDLGGGISYSKLFYNGSSTLVGSSVTSTFNANLNYDIGDIITPTISADYNINTGITNDLFLNFGLAHDFIAKKIFGNKDIIIISPTIAANWGTQNFYDAYITGKVYKNKKANTQVTAYQSSLGQFKLLDYELSAPLEYKAGHFIFEFIPTYAIVQNRVKSAAVAKALGLSNNTSVFYVEIGLALRF
jgi:hypothetical protein